MTNEEIAELRRLLAAATPGPWQVWADEGDHLSVCTEDHVAGTHTCLVSVKFGEYPDNAYPNAALIIALRDSADALLSAAEEAERLRAELQALKLRAYSLEDAITSAGLILSGDSLYPNPTVKRAMKALGAVMNAEACKRQGI